MKVVAATFVKSATEAAHYPPPSLPEVAFLGRSNVGKSSLINSLLGVHGLARTSNTPGRTQLINFFEINGELRFVDLPGYGYARVPQAVREQWRPMIEGYLRHRAALALCVLIVDARLEPQSLDLVMQDWLTATARRFCVVATKSDKLSRSRLAARLTALRRVYGDRVLPYSSLTRAGAELVWETIRSALVDWAAPRARA
ncbi:MAG: ribosome biogenesis GTP-binding protein YihA/YsxC [Chloracidobacterium sp.]|uniref:Probable GTP-binding protein EngB n=1 Tax=Chloracidobacterium validum TaxID=2821543 RepID=A0ABX8BCT5_9BACT|nr:ribosome biogenesis GTP-binding protein YihA/YsxC [Chloracidobacterium validum]QUW02895.1 YihA family ribosome biogenesis GTP-binding protein [Chloracidobacterium validum]